MIIRTINLEIQNWLKENGVKYIKNFFMFLVIMFIALSFIDTFLGNDKIKQQYNGLIVTDKQGKSYMIRHSIFGRFKINEFDINKMRLIE